LQSWGRHVIVRRPFFKTFLCERSGGPSLVDQASARARAECGAAWSRLSIGFRDTPIADAVDRHSASVFLVVLALLMAISPPVWASRILVSNPLWRAVGSMSLLSSLCVSTVAVARMLLARQWHFSGTLVLCVDHAGHDSRARGCGSRCPAAGSDVASPLDDADRNGRWPLDASVDLRVSDALHPRGRRKPRRGGRFVVHAPARTHESVTRAFQLACR
jgi:hypothetical protein